MSPKSLWQQHQLHPRKDGRPSLKSFGLRPKSDHTVSTRASQEKSSLVSSATAEATSDKETASQALKHKVVSRRSLAEEQSVDEPTSKAARGSKKQTRKESLGAMFDCQTVFGRIHTESKSWLEREAWNKGIRRNQSLLRTHLLWLNPSQVPTRVEGVVPKTTSLAAKRLS
jgi:hypothetical protein